MGFIYHYVNTISLNKYFYNEPPRKVKGSDKAFTNEFFKRVIISAYSKSSNSSVFSPILQKFCEMICEMIIVYKTT